MLKENKVNLYHLHIIFSCAFPCPTPTLFIATHLTSIPCCSLVNFFRARNSLVSSTRGLLPRNQAMVGTNGQAFTEHRKSTLSPSSTLLLVCIRETTGLKISLRLTWLVLTCVEAELMEEQLMMCLP